MDELRLAMRRLLKLPASTLASIGTLACAIGAAAVTWSTLSAVLLEPLTVRRSDELVIVSTMATTGPFAGTLQRGVTYPYYAHVRDSAVFDQVAAAWLPPVPLLTRINDATPERADIGFVTHEFFDVLGLGIPAGRDFTAEDDRRGAPPVAILSQRYWQRAWNAAADAIGQTFSINDRLVTVVGIAPPRFRGINLAEAPDIYLPFHIITDVGSPNTNYLAETNHQSSPSSMVTIVARLGEGTTPALATSRLATLPPPTDPRVVAPVAASPLNAEALPVRSRAGVARFSGLLAATVCLLLVAGCTTVGLLLLLRTEARREEFAMCLALGATRGRLTRGILAEGMVMASAAAVLSIPVAVWLFALLKSYQLPGGVAIDLLELSIDARVLSAAAVSAAVAIVAISFVAATFAFRARIADAIRSRAGATPRAAGRFARGALVTAQVAIALFLLAGAGVFARSLTGALHLNDGIDDARLVTVSIALRPYGYTSEHAAAFFDELRQRLASNPSVRSVASTVNQSSMGGPMPIDGIRRRFPTDVRFFSVDERYFETLGISIQSGRNFSAADTKNAPPVGIVSASFARQLAVEGKEAIGRRITMPYSFPPAPPPRVEVIGVVPDVITSVSVLEPLVLYMPIAQQYPIASREFLVRAATDADAARHEVFSTIRQLDPSVTPAPMYTLQERVGHQMSAQRFGATVLAALGIVAMFLTLFGTFVLADWMATMRMREMGIRAALGATRRQLGSIVLGETVRLVGIGVVAGLALAWLGANTIRSFLFQVQPLDPLTLGSVSLLILLLALGVSLRAALRVARVDLSSVLKAE